MDQHELQNRIRKAAHDVRSPVTTIAGFADLLAKDASLSDDNRDVAETIVAETRRLSAMLEDFFADVTVEPEDQ